MTMSTELHSKSSNLMFSWSSTNILTWPGERLEYSLLAVKEPRKKLALEITEILAALCQVPQTGKLLLCYIRIVLYYIDNTNVIRSD